MFENLTPHAVNIYDLKGEREILVVPPSGTHARAEVSYTPDGEVDGVPATRATYGEVVGLPAPTEGVNYIVSSMVAAHPSVVGRKDVFAPGERVIRDKVPVGCAGLKRA